MVFLACGYLKLSCQYVSLPVPSDSPSSPHSPLPSALCCHRLGASLEDSLYSAHTSVKWPFFISLQSLLLKSPFIFLPGSWLTDPGTPPCHSWVSILGNSHTGPWEDMNLPEDVHGSTVYSVGCWGNLGFHRCERGLMLGWEQQAGCLYHWMDRF